MYRVDTKGVLLKFMLFLIPSIVILSSMFVVLKQEDVKGVDTRKSSVVDTYPPYITNLMPNVVGVESEYFFVPRVVSRDYDNVRVELVESPLWMYVQGDGTVRGYPLEDDLGTHRVILRVADSMGSSTITEYIIVIENE